MEFTQNNLKIASSPYLLQHKDNPIWWQEYSQEVLEYARVKNKIIFVSIGYATCHWCHVMAQEAFSNREIADYLNAHFVTIKVDREQRPDIDQYAMAFIYELSGQGGWPLNIFFTSKLQPIYALTYAPVESRYGMPRFLEILQEIKSVHDLQKDRLAPFVFRREKISGSEEARLVHSLWDAFDKRYAGFGTSAKFPPHSIILFMLYYYEVTKDRRLEEMIARTLDMMAEKGLHDHLQGGFFRYCIDRTWTIPHFEKMLYDQALLLWEYSLAFHVMKKEAYKITAQKLLQCLRESFEQDGLYYSGHDADTDHHEGASYLWAQEEIRRILTQEELARLIEVYDICAEGNFEGKNHLTKKQNVFLEDIEQELLAARKKRPQPFVDRKIITSWNCLAGIGFIQAYRYLGDESLLEKAQMLYRRLTGLHYSDGKLFHTSLDRRIQKEEFLQDYAAMLLFLTYLHEETGMYAEDLDEFYMKVNAYKREGEWVESDHRDFFRIPADIQDSPIPSSVSLSDFAILRTDFLRNREYTQGDFSAPLIRDFFNIAVLMRNGFFHLIETPKETAFKLLPANAIQVKGKEYKDCYLRTCSYEQKLC